MRTGFFFAVCIQVMCKVHVVQEAVVVCQACGGLCGPCLTQHDSSRVYLAHARELVKVAPMCAEDCDKPAEMSCLQCGPGTC